MRLTKAALLQVIDDAQQATDREIARYNEAREQYQAERHAVWVNEVLPLWGELSTMIEVWVQMEKPITQEMVGKCFRDLPESLKGHYDTLAYCKNSNLPSFTLNDGTAFKGKPVPDKRLDTLRRLLESIADEYVSTSALADLGFRNLEWLYQRAVND
jgi:hypothetical protein